QFINGKLSGLTMRLEFEAILQHRLQHQPELRGRRGGVRRLCFDVVVSGVDPVGTTDQLERPNAIGLLNDVSKLRLVRPDSASGKRLDVTLTSKIRSALRVRLDGDDLKPRQWPLQEQIEQNSTQKRF